MTECACCHGVLWVCEEHGLPWDGGDLIGDDQSKPESWDDCGGPGMPCPDCNGVEPHQAPPGSILLTDFQGHGLWEEN